MGILARLERRPMAATQTGSASVPPTDPVLGRWLSSVTSSGKVVTEDAASKISAAWCCRRIIAESIGMLPWSMFAKDSSGNAEKADDHWLQDVLVHSPNRDQTSVEFRESEAMGLTGDGNAYSVIEKMRNRVTSLTPIFGVEPYRKKGSNTTLAIADGEVFFRFSDRGKPTDLPREKVWQVKGFGRDLLRGLSPIGAAREALGGALAMEEFANRFFSQGGMPAGTVTFPGWLTPEQKIEAQEALNKMVGGLGNAHQVALFQGGMKPEPWNTMNLEEMQFIFSRKFSVLEICRFYRVPPHMVAELEKGASYASIEQMSQEFVMFTLMPYLTRFEASASKWLLPAEERRRFFLRFNFEGLLRADSKGRAEMYSIMVQNGIFNRNEVRAKENMNRVEGLDGFTAQTNLASVEKIVEGALDKAVEKIAARLTPRDEPQPQIVVVGGAQQDSRLSLQLPEKLAREMKYTVDHPRMKAIEDAIHDKLTAVEAATSRAVASVRAAAEASNAALRADARAEVERISQSTQEKLEEVARSAKLPRRVVYDDKGDVLGTEVVESLTKH